MTWLERAIQGKIAQRLTCVHIEGVMDDFCGCCCCRLARQCAQKLFKMKQKTGYTIQHKIKSKKSNVL